MISATTAELRVAPVPLDLIVSVIEREIHRYDEAIEEIRVSRIAQNTYAITILIRAEVGHA